MSQLFTRLLLSILLSPEPAKAVQAAIDAIEGPSSQSVSMEGRPAAQDHLPSGTVTAGTPRTR